MGNCCVTRDRNDNISGIESRNDKFFYFNYPKLISDLDQRLQDVEKNGNPHSNDINHLKWAA
jgi:hypothetical protein